MTAWSPRARMAANASSNSPGPSTINGWSLRQLERSAELCVRIAPFDRNIGPFDIAQVVQSGPKRFGKWMRRRQRHEHTEARYFSKLLRLRRDRPRGSRAAEQRDELPTSQVRHGLPSGTR